MTIHIYIYILTYINIYIYIYIDKIRAFCTWQFMRSLQVKRVSHQIAHPNRRCAPQAKWIKEASATASIALRYITSLISNVSLFVCSILWLKIVCLCWYLFVYNHDKCAVTQFPKPSPGHENVLWVGFQPSPNRNCFMAV